MNNTQLIRHYMLFYAITMLGSTLSAVAIFLNIEPLFHSNLLLGAALSLKTLFLAAIAGPAVYFIKRFGLWSTLIASQAIGIVFLGVVALGFLNGSPTLVLLGSTGVGIPTVFLRIITTVNIKLIEDSESAYRARQGQFGILAGFTFLLSALTVGLLREKLPINYILAFDGATYVAGIIVLFSFSHSFKSKLEDRHALAMVPPPAARAQGPRYFIANTSVQLFALALTAIYLLKGFAPILAGSGSHAFSMNLSHDLRQSLWALEAAAMLLSGYLYKRYANLFKTTSFDKILFFNAIFIIPMAFYQSIYLAAICTFGLSLTITIGFMKFRDDLVLAQPPGEMVDKASGFAAFLENVIMTLSPILITGLLTVLNGIGFCSIMFCVQLTAWMIYSWKRQGQNTNTPIGTRFKRNMLIGLALVGVMFNLTIFSVGYKNYRDYQEKQIHAWLESFPKSVLPHLVESDHAPIFSKLKLVQETNLFNSFEIADSHGMRIASFGVKNDMRMSLENAWPIKDDVGNNWGYYKYQPNRWGNLAALALPAVLAGFMSVLLLFLISRYLQRRLTQEFDDFAKFIKELESAVDFVSRSQYDPALTQKEIISSQSSFEEAARIREIVLRLVNEIREFQSKAAATELQAEKAKALYEISAQVAHDIRSPLAAVSVIEKDLNRLPENQRLILRRAINRIRDIASDLLDQNRSERTSIGQDTKTENTSVQLVSTLVEQLVSEKRLQFRPKIGIEIETHMDANAYGLFADLQPGELKRVISNLVNNSIEALGERGKVDISLSRNLSFIEIRVQDNGKGIPPTLLPRLGQKGETFGKKAGSGLGLYHARTCVESWGGSFKIESEPDLGTIVTLLLPIVSAPNWFVDELRIKANAPIVILDDDVSIHQIWRERFQSLGAIASDIKIFDFSTPQEIRDWVKLNPDLNDVTYLMDFELLGYRENGLDICEQLGISQQTILVSSRSDEPKVRARCEQLGIKMIPKGLAAFVPIEMVSAGNAPELVLIDDDPLIRAAWQMAAQDENKEILVYSSAAGFLSEATKLGRDLPVYIDSDLGEGVAGEEIARQISLIGFTNLYLETGYPASHFPDMPWLRGIVGKDPVFSNRRGGKKGGGNGHFANASNH